MGIENVDYGVAARWNEATRAKEREESQVERKPFDISGCIESTEKAIAAISEVYQDYHIKEFSKRIWIEISRSRTEYIFLILPHLSL